MNQTVDEVTWRLAHLTLSDNLPDRLSDPAATLDSSTNKREPPVSWETSSMIAAINQARNQMVKDERGQPRKRPESKQTHADSLVSIMAQRGPPAARESAVEQRTRGIALTLVPNALSMMADHWSHVASRAKSCVAQPMSDMPSLASPQRHPSKTRRDASPSPLSSFDALVSDSLSSSQQAAGSQSSLPAPSIAGTSRTDHKHNNNNTTMEHHDQAKGKPKGQGCSTTGGSGSGDTSGKRSDMEKPDIPLGRSARADIKSSCIPQIESTVVNPQNQKQKQDQKQNQKQNQKQKQNTDLPVSPWLQWWLQLQQLKPDSSGVANLRQKVSHAAHTTHASGQGRHEFIQRLVLQYDQIFFKGVLKKMIDLRNLKLHLTHDPSIKDVLGVFTSHPSLEPHEFKISIGGDEAFVSKRDFKDSEIQVIDCTGQFARNNLEILQSIIEHMIIHFLERACDSHSPSDDRHHSDGFKRACRAIFMHRQTSSHRAIVRRIPSNSNRETNAESVSAENHASVTGKNVGGTGNGSLTVGMTIEFIDMQLQGSKPQKGIITKLNKKTLSVRLANNTFWMGKYDHFRRVK